MLLSERDLERFMSKVFYDTCGKGCMIWTDACHPYGRFKVGWESRNAHVIAYELENGPVPQGFHVHHECEMKCCVNPAHLDAISAQEHPRLPKKAYRKGKQKEKPDSVRLVIDHFGTASAAAEYLGVSKAAISSWKKVPLAHARRLQQAGLSAKLFWPRLYAAFNKDEGEISAA